MNPSRRGLLKMLAGVAALAAFPLRVLAGLVWPQAAFTAKDLDSVFAELGGVPPDSDLIQLDTPDIAENGAVVPVEVTSGIPGTSRIYLLVEKNPNPMSAGFAIPKGTEPYVATRVKVAQTCLIYAVVEADGKFYKAGRETKVTLGGCGG
jgi:sulfur-oxidizing protein SoxY